MARSRNIKPGFFKNESLAECTPLARLLFAGLWCLADREGRLEDRPKRIRVEVLPYDDGSVDEMLQELHEAGFILRYTASCGRFIQVMNFTKHQNPHHREAESTIPAPPKPETSPGLALDKPETSPELAVLIPDSLNLIPDSLNLIPDSLNLGSDAGASVVAGNPVGHLACPVEKIIEAYHEAMPLNPRCKVQNESRRSAIRQRWREAAQMIIKPFGYKTQAGGLAAWLEFFSVCAESNFLTGRVASRDGKPPFLADIDFLFSPNGFAKCLENKYHRELA